MLEMIKALDFYKTGHGPQYPQGTEQVYGNFTPRSNKYAQTDQIVVVGAQRFIAKRLIRDFNKSFFKADKTKALKKYQRRMDNALGKGVVGVEHLAELHDLGYLPIRVKGLPEGSRVNPGIPVLTITNTVDKFFWLVNYLETMLSCEMWQPMTNASVAAAYYDILANAAERTGTPQEFVPMQAHDFSMRGMAGIEAAAASGASHLMAGFVGTDTVLAIDDLEEWYYADSDKEMVGISVPATEHAVMCMGTKEDEIGTFRRLIEMYPSGVMSIVSDTWNLWTVLTKYAPALKEEIEARQDVFTPEGEFVAPAKVVFRPDSGDPVKILTGWKVLELTKEEVLLNEDGSCCVDTEQLLHGVEAFKIDEIFYERVDFNEVGRVIELPEIKGVVQLLWDSFGGDINEKGFKQLGKVGAIYGDSITLERAKIIMDRLEANGFASGNVVLGVGSFTYQYNTRDTYGMAMKATWGKVNGEAREIFKDPITDDGTKKSATGLLRVEYEDGEFVLYDRQTEDEEKRGCLQVIFEDGKMYNQTTLAEIRARITGQ